MLPNALPSHPKGLDKRLFKHPYSKTLTPSNHPSEIGLPWNAHLEQPAEAPEKDLTSRELSARKVFFFDIIPWEGLGVDLKTQSPHLVTWVLPTNFGNFGH